MALQTKDLLDLFSSARKLSLRIAWVAAVFSLTPNVSGQEAVSSLSYRFLPKEVLRYQVETEGKVTLLGTKNGQELKLFSKAFLSAVLRTREVDQENVAVIEAEIAEFKMVIKVNDQEVARLPPLTEKSKLIKVGRTGIIPAPVGREAVSPTNALAWNLLLSRIFPALPEGSVRVGSTWLGQVLFSHLERLPDPKTNSVAVRYTYLGRSPEAGAAQVMVETETGAPGQIKGKILFGDGHLILEETSGVLDFKQKLFSPEKGLIEVTTKGTLFSRAVLLP